MNHNTNGQLKQNAERRSKNKAQGVNSVCVCVNKREKRAPKITLKETQKDEEKEKNTLIRRRELVTFELKVTACKYL